MKIYIKTHFVSFVLINTIKKSGLFKKKSIFFLHTHDLEVICIK